jgi:hypothetical protein
MCTLHPFTAQYMCAPCHERFITKMMSKQLTSLNILGLYLHLGSTEEYYRSCTWIWYMVVGWLTEKHSYVLYNFDMVEGCLCCMIMYA